MSYLVPANNAEVEEIIKNSRFITRTQRATTAEAAKDSIRQLSQAEQGASHNCWAYIIGDPQSTTLIGCSDDGEVSGTAGKPMLNVLQHSGIGDIVVVCSRYYGGTKLGTGGLMRAYSGGVKLALEQLKTQEKVATEKLTLLADYSISKDLEHCFKIHMAEVCEQQFAEQIEYCIELPLSNKNALLEEITVRFGENLNVHGN